LLRELSDGCRSERRLIERGEGLSDRPPMGGSTISRATVPETAAPVLQLRKLVRDVAGSRSRRVETAWPNFTKIGPSSSSASRSRSPRLARRPRSNRHWATERREIAAACTDE